MKKTTFPDGSIHQIYEDSDLDDEILPRRRGKLILPHLIACIIVGGLLVFGIASLFCI